jgi:hypothetical protein
MGHLAFACCSSRLRVHSIFSEEEELEQYVRKKAFLKGFISSKSNRVVTLENMFLTSKSGNRFEVKSRLVPRYVINVSN